MQMMETARRILILLLVNTDIQYCSYKVFRSFPNTYCILLTLPEVKGPVEVAPTVSRLLNSYSMFQGAFTARVIFMLLQQNLPAQPW